MPHQHLIITLLSDDKPGIVHQVADQISHAGGNWLESRMSQLAGKFAGILRVSIDEEKVPELKSSLDKLTVDGIQILVDTANDSPPTNDHKTLAFELVGADRTGIVSEIAHAFTENGISIDELETQCSSMPWSGDPLFEATGILLAPVSLNKDELLDRLNDIENSLAVDISLTEQL